MVKVLGEEKIMNNADHEGAKAIGDLADAVTPAAAKVVVSDSASATIGALGLLTPIR